MGIENELYNYSNLCGESCGGVCIVSLVVHNESILYEIETVTLHLVGIINQFLLCKKRKKEDMCEWS